MRLFVLVAYGSLLFAESADRSVAEWTLSMGGRVGLQGDPRRISDIDQLPKGDFALEVLDWIGINADPPDLERLTGLQHLKALHLAGPFWNGPRPIMVLISGLAEFLYVVSLWRRGVLV